MTKRHVDPVWLFIEPSAILLWGSTKNERWSRLLSINFFGQRKTNASRVFYFFPDDSADDFGLVFLLFVQTMRWQATWSCRRLASPAAVTFLFAFSHLSRWCSPGVSVYIILTRLADGNFHPFSLSTDLDWEIHGAVSDRGTLHDQEGTISARGINEVWTSVATCYYCAAVLIKQMGRHAVSRQCCCTESNRWIG